MFYAASSELILNELKLRRLNEDAERALLTSLQCDLKQLEAALPRNTLTEPIDVRSSSATGDGAAGVRTEVLVQFRTFDRSEDGWLTLADMEEALGKALPRMNLVSDHLKTKSAHVVWETTPVRCFKWTLELVFTDVSIARIVAQRTPTLKGVVGADTDAETTDGEQLDTPPPEPNTFETVISGGSFEGDAAAAATAPARTTRRRREELTKKLVKRAAAVDNEQLQSVVRASRARASQHHQLLTRVSPTTAAPVPNGSPKRQLALETKAYPQISVAAAAPRRGVQKRNGSPKKAGKPRLADAKSTTTSPPTMSAASSAALEQPSLLTKALSFVFASTSVPQDAYVRQYSTRPRLFQRVQKK